MSALWHPFADMADVAGRELVIARGEGVFVWDTDGNRYVDGAASLWYANVGHGRREIHEAIARQLEQLETFHTFNDLATPTALELAERLSALAPVAGSKIFLTSGGGDSIETAAKLARLHHRARGDESRRWLISRERGYHGTHGIGTSILGLAGREEFGPLVDETARVAWDSVDALAEEVERLGAENVAAFVYEPVIGSGGVLVPPPGYLEGAHDVCRRHGILTIADAVIGGFGRLGTWFAIERFDVEPDLIVFAKGVTSGYLPLGGLVVAPWIAEPFWVEGGPSFAHGATYSGHATCCAAALANLDLLERDGLVHRALELEQPFHARVAQVESHALVAEVRGGVGLMAAVALHDDALVRPFWLAARARGLLTRMLPDGLALAPPLIVEDEHVELMTQSLEQALDSLAGA